MQQSKRFGNYRNIRTVGMYDTPPPVKRAETARNITTDELQRRIYDAGAQAFRKSHACEFELPATSEDRE